MSAQAFIDESGRGSTYYVCAAVIADDDVNDVRRTARAWCLPGQRRWHFVHERDSRRRQIIDALSTHSQVQALIFHGNGRDTTIRPESLRRLVTPLLDRHVTRLIIESRRGRDQQDRQVLLAALHTHPGGFSYDHMPPYGDPLLWLADAFAWCASAGGIWRERIAPLVAVDEDVTRL